MAAKLQFFPTSISGLQKKLAFYVSLSLDKFLTSLRQFLISKERVSYHIDYFTGHFVASLRKKSYIFTNFPCRLPMRRK